MLAFLLPFAIRWRAGARSQSDPQQHEADGIICGGSSAAVITAVQFARMGRLGVVVSPDVRLCRAEANPLVELGAPSGPCLMTGFGGKNPHAVVRCSPAGAFFGRGTVVMDFSPVSEPYAIGQHYIDLEVPARETGECVFPDGFSAHWLRLKANRACRSTAMFDYS